MLSIIANANEFTISKNKDVFNMAFFEFIEKN